eukprot:scaffold3586_cov164-Amphora_coffeaeformis.AAC.26
MAKNVLFSIIWILLLIFIAWPVAGFCAGIWVILQPFEAVLGFVKQINNFLEKLITWPRECGQALHCHCSYASHVSLSFWAFLVRLRVGAVWIRSCIGDSPSWPVPNVRHTRPDATNIAAKRESSARISLPARMLVGDYVLQQHQH